MHEAHSTKKGAKNFFSYLLTYPEKNEQTSKGHKGSLLLEDPSTLKFVRCLKKKVSLELIVKEFQVGIESV